MLYCAMIAVAVINLITFITYGIDKLKAKSKGCKSRISERVLLTMAAIGGSLGALVAMQAFRHKTQHAKFKYGIPALLILHIALAIYILLKL